MKLVILPGGMNNFNCETKHNISFILDTNEMNYLLISFKNYSVTFHPMCQLLMDLTYKNILKASVLI